MKNLLLSLCCFLMLNVVFAQNSSSEPAFNANYQVTFEANWSASTHPTDFPSNNPHFSGLVGTTHGQGTHIFQMGELATSGIKQMAETGAKSLLINEVNSLINNQLAENLLSGGGIEQSPGSVNLQFSISQKQPLVSLVSMIAPSPDWFVGVNGLNLRQNGQWVEEISVDLLPYDAGTDNGSTYNSSNSSTNPAAPISLINQAPLNNNVPLGRFVFNLLSTDGLFVFEGKHSGLYYDQNRSGEGANLTVSQVGDRHFIILNMYTFRNGQQMWLIGTADFQAGDESVTMEIFRTEGTSFGMDFNTNDIQTTSWGTAILSIPSCDHLNIDFTGTEITNETISLEYSRLAGIQGLVCE
jgi:hypothetical protein